jgi:hypothetical protein
MRGAIPPLPKYVFMAWCLVKHRDNFLPYNCNDRVVYCHCCKLYICKFDFVVTVLSTVSLPYISVCTASGYGLKDWMIGFLFPAWAGNFSLHHRVQTGSEAHPASYPMGIGGSFPEGRAAGREADHPPPFSAEVKECVVL